MGKCTNPIKNKAVNKLIKIYLGNRIIRKN